MCVHVFVVYMCVRGVCCVCVCVHACLCYMCVCAGMSSVLCVCKHVYVICVCVCAGMSVLCVYNLYRCACIRLQVQDCVYNTVDVLIL